ncbi:lachesin-like [Babylonia areolata]|uniref:lachesin-like n=1 Tax=Babylonia areolata TaxID=304850 RepID=UPI003FD51B9F
MPKGPGAKTLVPTTTTTEVKTSQCQPHHTIMQMSTSSEYLFRHQRHQQATAGVPSVAGLRREQREKDKAMDEHPVNITVIQGSTAVLPCSVDPRYTEQHKDQYKVVWVSPTQTAISMEDRRMINDMRMSVERPFLKDWNLHIRNVSITDAGEFLCQLNTNPVQSKTVKLFVNVPPMIVEYTQPVEMTRMEGEMVKLSCNATGVPTPNVTWYRMHRWSSAGREQVGAKGEQLIIYNVSRMCADVYQCIADNGVPPATKQEFIVDVNYPPEIELHNTRIGQEVGKETILECVISGSPLHVTRWRRGNEVFGNNLKDRYEVNIYDHNAEPNTIVLSLRIVRVEEADYGDYICEASNNFGEVIRVMELYEVTPKPPPVTTMTTTTTTTTAYLWVPRGVTSKNIHHHGSGSRQKKPGSPMVISQPESANQNADRLGPGQYGSTPGAGETPSSIHYIQQFAQMENHWNLCHNAGEVYDPNGSSQLTAGATTTFLSLCLTSALGVARILRVWSDPEN